MREDFHYHCIGVLARAAGFKEHDALTIAYASQYVDDSTESEPIQVGDMIFDPVRTAHSGLESFEWSVQKRVFIPFHFIPPKPFDSPQDRFVTQPDSTFAHMIWEEAINTEDALRQHCALGLVLHTLADTWAHQGFSGRRDEENDVEDIHIREDNKWKHLLWENIYLDILPKIGHAEAGLFPDQTYLTWKYKRNKPKKKTVRRANTDDFFTASETLYKLLRKLKKPDGDRAVPWKNIKDRIHDLLADPEEDLSERCDMWREAFKDLLEPTKFSYDRLQWRREALGPKRDKDIVWDDFHPSDFKHLQFAMTPNFYDTPWVQFHRAALKQRHFVLERLL